MSKKLTSKQEKEFVEATENLRLMMKIRIRQINRQAKKEIETMEEDFEEMLGDLREMILAGGSPSQMIDEIKKGLDEYGKD